MISAIWERFKWVLTHGLWFIAGIVILIDPQHVYEFAHRHEAWAALIMAIWAALLAWAQKQRPAPSPDQRMADWANNYVRQAGQKPPQPPAEPPQHPPGPLKPPQKGNPK